MKKNGFTLVELLIALVVVATFLLLVIGTVMSLSRSREVSGQRELVRRTAADIVQELTHNIRLASQISVDDSSEFDVLVLQHEQEELLYRVVNGALEKNTSRWTPDEVQVTQLSIQKISDAEVPLLRIMVTVTSARDVEITAQQQSVVSLRYAQKDAITIP